MSQAGGVEPVLSALLDHLLSVLTTEPWPLASTKSNWLTLSTLIIINLASDHEATYVLMMTMVMNFSFYVRF